MTRVESHTIHHDSSKRVTRVIRFIMTRRHDSCESYDSSWLAETSHTSHTNENRRYEEEYLRFPVVFRRFRQNNRNICWNFFSFDVVLAKNFFRGYIQIHIIGWTFNQIKLFAHIGPKLRIYTIKFCTPNSLGEEGEELTRVFIF